MGCDNIFQGNLIDGFSSNNILITCEKEIYCDKFIKIGQGGQGIIYKGNMFFQNNGNYLKFRDVAIKHIILGDDSLIKNIDEQMNILLSLKSDYVIEYIGYCYSGHNIFYDDNNYNQSFQSSIIELLDTNELKKNEFDVYIFMEYVDGVNLDKYIKDKISNGIINKNELITLVNNLLYGLKFIHSNNIAHRDIKPSNIMVEINFENIKVKYIDFEILYENEKIATILFSSPELIENSKTSDPFKNDMWSLGLTIYYLCTFEMLLPYIRDTIEFIYFYNFLGEIKKSYDILPLLSNKHYYIDDSYKYKLINIIMNLLNNPLERKIITFDEKDDNILFTLK